MIQAPQGDGRPCPPQMEQWKPCLVRPCFHWRYSSWSECRTEVSHPASQGASGPASEERAAEDLLLRSSPG